MNICEHLAGSGSVNEMLQDGAVKLIAECYSRNQQKCSNPTTFPTFENEQKPQEADGKESNGILVQIGDKGHYDIEDGVLKSLITHVEQASVKAVQKVDQAVFLLQWASTGSAWSICRARSLIQIASDEDEDNDDNDRRNSLAISLQIETDCLPILSKFLAGDEQDGIPNQRA